MSMLCPRCLKELGTANGSVHTCSPTDWARKLETRVAELERREAWVKNYCEQMQIDPVDEHSGWAVASSILQSLNAE